MPLRRRTRSRNDNTSLISTVSADAVVAVAASDAAIEAAKSSMEMTGASLSPELGAMAAEWRRRDERSAT